jgi:hypothetical protein
MTIPEALIPILFRLAERVLALPKGERRDLMSEEHERAIRRQFARERARARAAKP